MHYDLSGRLVAITGSTGGLGRALARTLHERSARPALLDIDEQAIAAMRHVDS